MNILVVDDDDDIVESTVMLLQMEGHEVRSVRRAAEIVEVARAFQPRVVLHDINMPGLDLPATVLALREAVAGTRVLLFTASALAIDQVQIAGADGLLAKPFQAEDLKRAIEHAAGRSRTRS